MLEDIQKVLVIGSVRSSSGTAEFDYAGPRPVTR